MNELLLKSLRWASVYFAASGGSEMADYRLTARSLKRLYGHTPARSFGPLAPRACLAEWVRDGAARKPDHKVPAGLSREECDRRLRMAKRIFR